MIETMCNNSTCVVKAKCLRFMTTPDKVQGYYPYENYKGGCTNFINNGGWNREVYSEPKRLSAWKSKKR